MSLPAKALETLKQLPGAVIGDFPARVRDLPAPSASDDAPELAVDQADSTKTEDELPSNESPRGELPMHYGDLLGEQERLAHGQAVTVLPMGAIRLTGSERLTWLNNLVSQEMLDLHHQPKYWRETLWLDANGHITWQGFVADNGEETLILAEDAPALAEFLNRMRFRSDVQVTDLSETHLVLGDMIERELESELTDISGVPGIVLGARDPWPDELPGGTTYTGALPHAAHPGERQKRRLTLVRTEDALGWLGQLGTGFTGSVQAGTAPAEGCRWQYLAGYLAWEAQRIAAWRPTTSDFDGKALPHEFDLLRSAVHLHKGCYCGQETVARIVNVGRPPRRLAAVDLDGSEHELPERGATIKAGEKEDGTLLARAVHYEQGPIGLALLRRSLDARAVLQVGEVAAASTTIVAIDGKAEASPSDRPGKELRGQNLRGNRPRLN
ncbi:hypothetical protein BK816_01500 [Boudabousia tangfeifanii]|uniref:CAF17 C-terminal domain-containing protein n=1 Tax=Boudabousia tangfeifanii TaxID=1912795 RepID=A0A1D9MIW4_9ACTO|nr:hypothetical protein [Boudabousia tangfeifanii]AOZ72133.1 hypothetical protein BK816_01500 [Boudabousia tangfeifanii]